MAELDLSWTECESLSKQHRHGFLTYYNHYDPSKLYFPMRSTKGHPGSADAVLFNAYRCSIDYRIQYKTFNGTHLLLPKQFSYKLFEWCTRYKDYVDELSLKVTTEEQYFIYSQLLEEFPSRPIYPKVTLIDYSYLELPQDQSYKERIDRVKENLNRIDREYDIGKIMRLISLSA